MRTIGGPVRSVAVVLAIATGVLTAFAGALWSVHGRRIPALEVLVLGFVVVAVGLLQWLRPRPISYALGLLCLLLAFIGWWLASPIGWRWTANRIGLTYEAYGGFNFFVLCLLFPVGWILLTHSVANWRIGLASYAVAGLVFTLMAAAASWFGPPGYGHGQTPLELFITLIARRRWHR